MSGKFRSKKTFFSQVSNSALRDPGLSLKAKGLYALIQSYITIEGFLLYKSHLVKQNADGIKSFESTWAELKQKGYLIQHKTRGENGSFCYEYDLLDTGFSNDSPHPQKGGSGKRRHGERGVYNNTNLINTDLNNIEKHLHFDKSKRLYSQVNFEDEKTNLLARYCFGRFGSELRQSSDSLDDAYKEADNSDFIEFLEDNIKEERQCNIDYLNTIVCRLLW
jgi:hypothetical protein